MKAHLFDRASAESLGLVRIAVFGYWFASFCLWPVSRIADFPAQLVTPRGVLGWLPADWFTALLSPAILTVLHIAAITSCVAAAAGLPGYRGWATIAAATAVIVDGLRKGLEGYVNHSQSAILYLAMALVFVSAADGLALRRPGPRRTREYYRAATTALALILVAGYFLIGARRLAVGPGVLFDGSIQVWLATRALRPSAYGILLGWRLANLPWAALPLKLGFAVSTLFEIASPLVVVSDRFRQIWLAAILLLHLATFLGMNILFWQMMVLDVLILSRAGYLVSPSEIAWPGRWLFRLRSAA